MAVLDPALAFISDIVAAKELDEVDEIAAKTASKATGKVGWCRAYAVRQRQLTPLRLA